MLCTRAKVQIIIMAITKGPSEAWSVRRVERDVNDIKAGIGSKGARRLITVLSRFAVSSRLVLGSSRVAATPWLAAGR